MTDTKQKDRQAVYQEITDELIAEGALKRIIGEAREINKGQFDGNPEIEQMGTIILLGEAYADEAVRHAVRLTASKFGVKKEDRRDMLTNPETQDAISYALLSLFATLSKALQNHLACATERQFDGIDAASFREE